MRAVLTAREQVEMLSPWRTAKGDDSWIPRTPDGKIDMVKYRELRRTTHPPPPPPPTKTLYHVTDNPDFALDPTKEPTEGMSLSPRMPHGIYLTDMPQYWRPWGRRPYVVGVEVPTELADKYRPALGGEPETGIPAEHFPDLKVTKVMPWEGYEQETRHTWAGGDPNPWNDDVRTWSPDQRKQYEDKFNAWYDNEYGTDEERQAWYDKEYGAD